MYSANKRSADVAITEFVENFRNHLLADMLSPHNLIYGWGGNCSGVKLYFARKLM